MRTQLLFQIPCIVALLAAGCRRGEQEPDSPPVAAVRDAGPRKWTLVDPATLDVLCRGDAMSIESAPYVKTPGAVSPVVYLFAAEGPQSYKLRRPGELTPWETTKVELAQLVACAQVVKATKVRECRLGDAVLEMYTATVAIRVLEARTGKEVARRTFENVAGGCPSSAWIVGNRSRDYGRLDVEVVRTIAPLQPAGVPLPHIASYELDDACRGKPALGGAPFQRTKGAFNAYAVFEREGDAAFAPVSVADTEIGKQAWFERNLAASGGQRAHVSMVVCLTATRGKARSCAYTEDKTLHVYDAKWHAVAVDPATGATLATAEVAARAQCPSMWNFHAGDEKLARPDLTAMLAPLVEPAP